MSKTKLFYPTSQKSWTAINWKKAERSIVLLQNRIMKASQKNKTRQVRNLQRLLIRSLSARLKSIREITEHFDDSYRFSSRYKFAQAIKLFNQKPVREFNASLKMSTMFQKSIVRNDKKNVNFQVLKNLMLQRLFFFSFIPLIKYPFDHLNLSHSKDLYQMISKIFSKGKYLMKLNIHHLFKIKSYQFLQKFQIDKEIFSKFLILLRKTPHHLDSMLIYQNGCEIKHFKFIFNYTWKLFEQFCQKFLKTKSNDGRLTIFYHDNECLIQTKTNFKKIKKLIAIFFNEMGLPFYYYDFLNIKVENFCGFKNWSFKNQRNHFVSMISSKTLKDHKKEIKFILKKSKNLSVKKIILKLREKIVDWKKEHFIKNEFIKISGQLEKYIFQLLWKWVTKRHNKKSHDWIFKNYWLKVHGKRVFSQRNEKSKRYFILPSYSNSQVENG